VLVSTIVFKCFLKDWSVAVGVFLYTNVSMDRVEVRSSTGRLFHVAVSDTAKSRRPIVVLVRGTTSVPLSADRSCHLPTTDETVSQAGRRQTVKASVGDHRQLEDR